MRTENLSIHPKDYVETADGLVFAVVSHVLDAGRLPVYLRYRKTTEGFSKLASGDAKAHLDPFGERFWYESSRRQIRMQGVELSDIRTVYRSRQRAQDLVVENPSDPIAAAAQRLLQILKRRTGSLADVGVTGSLLLGAQTSRSDIDLVVFDETGFHALRSAVLDAIREGDLTDLSPSDWVEAHDRRGPELSLSEYLWHERRKGNKAMIEGIKFDLTLVDLSRPEPEAALEKRGTLDLCARVTDATESFGFPARYRIDHPMITEVLAFSQTYAGQALAGETVRVRGRLETLQDGRQRLVVGADREASGEYIKVESEDS